MCSSDLRMGPQSLGGLAGIPVVSGIAASSSDQPSEWIVRLKGEALSRVSTLDDARAIVDRAGLGIQLIAGLGLPGMMLVRAGSTATGIGSSLASNPDLAMAERNDSFATAAIPNDPRFGELYGLHNTGQTGGTLDADIDAPEAWDVTTGSRNQVVGVIDTGIDVTHRDLYRNIWLNQGEIPAGLRSQLVDTDADGRITFVDLNGQANAANVTDLNGNGYIDAADLLADGRWANREDGDGNGFVDDICGWDFAGDDNDPTDDVGHGTHVAGTIGGSGNDGVGVVGVNWSVSLMALRFLAPSGTTANAIRAVNYATMMRTQFEPGLRVTSNSWGGGGYSAALKTAIDAGGQAGVLFVAAAGNAGQNSDVAPSYPAAYDSPSIISVAATDSRDGLATFSNYGVASVDIGAPGVGILSSIPQGRYATFQGTSMATPHVSGAAALALSANPALTVAALKQAILGTADSVSSLAGKTVSGGRLNLARLVNTVSSGQTDITISSSSVDENRPIGTVVGDFATAARVGGTWSYSLVSGAGSTDNGAFMIRGNSLVTGRVFDFESRSRVTVRVRATNGAGASFEKSFTISIRDVNEAPTSVQLANAVASIAENANTAAAVRIADVVIADDALGRNVISLAGADAGSFEVVGNRLQLRAGVRLDPVAKPTLAVTVNVADPTVVGSDPVSASHTLAVIRAGTRLVFGGPDFQFKGGSSNYVWKAGDYWRQSFTAVPLSSASRLDLSLQMASNSQSGAPLDFGVLVNDRTVGMFTLQVGVSGTRAFSFAFDAVAGPTFRIEIRALGTVPVGQGAISLALGGGSFATLSAAQPVPVVALGPAVVAENAPAGTVVGSLSIGGGSTASYRLAPGPGDTGNGLFAIVGDRLVTLGPLDFESQREHGIRVQATTATGLTVQRALTVVVRDVNERPTNLVLSSTTIRSGNAVGAVVGLLTATDPDAGDRHTFTLVNGTQSNDNALFSIVGGELRARVSLNAATRSNYTVRVRATDAGGLTFERDFTIDVLSTESRLARLSRVAGDGYARLVQGGIYLEQGQTYRFTVRMLGNVTLQDTDHIPEFWGNGQIFDGTAKRSWVQGDWTYLESTVTAPVSGFYELKLALWSRQSLVVTDVSLRSLAGGAELVKNGRFLDGLANWYTHGGTMAMA